MSATSFCPRLGRRALLLAPAGLSLGLGHVATPRAAAWQEPASPTLLVRGESTLTGGPMVWRVVLDVAETPPRAAFERHALGFAVAAGPFTALLLTDQATGSACRLTPGAAAFVRDGTWQRRESLGDAAQGYLRIGLVGASAARDAGGDRLLFPGPAIPTAAFLAPTGPVTLALHRVEIAGGQSVGVPPGAGDSETLVLVEQGEVELEIGEAAPRELLQTVVGSDTSYAIRSVGAAAMLFGLLEGTSVLIATIA